MNEKKYDYVPFAARIRRSVLDIILGVVIFIIIMVILTNISPY